VVAGCGCALGNGGGSADGAVVAGATDPGRRWRGGTCAVARHRSAGATDAGASGGSLVVSGSNSDCIAT